MTSLLSAAMERRAVEQLDGVEFRVGWDPAAGKAVSVRRYTCKCGCGRWWFWEQGTQRGRPSELATDDCRARWRRVRQARVKAARGAVDPHADSVEKR